MLVVALALLSASPTKDVQEPIEWIHDDWASAQTRATREGKLVAVDVWATWCHSCLSMKNFVLKERPLARVSKKHVWLALDYDRPENQTFFTKFPINAFPTFLVIDPQKGAVVGRWMGSATASQMADFFDGKSDTTAAELGQQALAAENYVEAIRIFEALLPSLRTPAERTRVLSGYIEALWKTDLDACATRGARYIEETDDTAPGLDYVGMVAYCASALDEKARRPILERVKARLERAAEKRDLGLSADDVSSLYDTLQGVYKELGDNKAASQALERRTALLERAASSARTPDERATFDAHRLGCYLELERFAEAEKMIAASETAMPLDFNHPWRRALLELARGRSAEGLSAIARALELGYGPRRLRLYSTKIDLLIAARQLEQARKTVDEARGEIAKLDPKLVRKASVAEIDGKAKKIEEAARLSPPK